MRWIPLPVGVENFEDLHRNGYYFVDKTLFIKELLDMKTTGADISHIVNAANENAFERTGIYKKMEEGSFTKSDIEALEITSEDFSKAVNEFSNNNGKTYKPIGFRQYDK